MERKDYTVKFFYESLPEWKRKIDSKPVRLFYRPMSFVLASICAKNGIHANTVSYMSAIIGIIGCALYIPANYWCHIIGALLINLWLVLDCTDGNLARCVKKQPFGEFADALSSYLLVGYMCIAIGFGAYMEGGLFLSPGCPWLILLGALASIADTMTRAVYHKYRMTLQEMVEKGVMKNVEDNRKAHQQRGFFRALFEDQFGLGGFLPLFILLATVFHALDIITLYFFFYYGCELVATLFVTVRGAIVVSRKYEMK